MRAFDHIFRDWPPHARCQVRISGSGVKHCAAAPVAIKLETHATNLDRMVIGKNLGHLNTARPRCCLVGWLVGFALGKERGGSHHIGTFM